MIAAPLVLRVSRNRVVRRAVRETFPRAFFTWFCRQQRMGRAMYTLSFDCDLEEDIKALPSVLATLARYGLTAAFAVVGRWVVEYPDLHRSIVRHGHEVVNHTHSHPERGRGTGRSFEELDPATQRDEILRCHTTCAEVLGVAPSGFRAPHFGDTFRQDLYDILRDLRYRYSSSTLALDSQSFGAPFRTSGVWEVPLFGSACDPFLIFDSWSGTRRFPDLGAFVDAFVRTIDVAARTEAYVTHYFDPHAVVEEGLLHRLCEALVRRRDRLAVLSYRDVLDIVADGA
jgi:hypothetical protein